MSPDALPDLEDFRSNARVWLEHNAEPLVDTAMADDEGGLIWGQGSDNVAGSSGESHPIQPPGATLEA